MNLACIIGEAIEESACGGPSVETVRTCAWRDPETELEDAALRGPRVTAEILAQLIFPGYPGDGDGFTPITDIFPDYPARQERKQRLHGCVLSG